MATEDGHQVVGNGKETRIHIDQKAYHSPNPTTADALYSLGHVKSDLVLYREVRGDEEDEVVRRSHDRIHLSEDEHFHSGPPPEITIIVMGTEYEWLKPDITYAEVVTLFDPAYPQHPEVTYSVKYKHGPAHKPESVLVPGASVKVKERMVFSVSPTGKS